MTHKEKRINRDDHTMQEFCGIVDRDRKTISRLIKQGRINPMVVKSKQGTHIRCLLLVILSIISYIVILY